jgi:CheY-specific phosphatase CheX
LLNGGIPKEASMHSAISPENIRHANDLFWEQMLAMRLEPIPHPEEVSQQRCIGSEHLVGSCILSGAWSGCIEIRLSSGLALEATGTMLMQPSATVLLADALDATKEIANMIAGALKSALPRPCTMSVPSAQLEIADLCVLPRTENSLTVFFKHSSGELMVRVSEGSV